MPPRGLLGANTLKEWRVSKSSTALAVSSRIVGPTMTLQREITQSKSEYGSSAIIDCRSLACGFVWKLSGQGQRHVRLQAEIPAREGSVAGSFPIGHGYDSAPFLLFFKRRMFEPSKDPVQHAY
jgi:hypothetical protein